MRALPHPAGAPWRRRAPRSLLSLLAILPLLCAAPAQAHGGLPVTTGVLTGGGRLYVPTQYWGVFVGSDDGPWRWICDEAIGGAGLREVALGADGTLYATDFPGLTISHDGGCTFTPVAGPIAALLVNGLIPDPSGRGAWLTGTGDGAPGAIYRTDDGGESWIAVRPADAATDPSRWLMRGAVVSADRRLHVLVDEGEAQDRPVLFTSRDGGAHFTALPLSPIPAGVVPGRVRPVYADPRDGGVVYVHFQGEAEHVLCRVDTERGEVSEILRTTGYVFDARLAPAGDRLLVASAAGLFAEDGTGARALRRSEALSRAQCLDGVGDALYACSWNWAPDRAAVARSSDGGASFRPLLRFDDVRGPLECPAGSPVARVCPAAWAQYGAQLAADPDPPTAQVPTGTAPAPGCRSAPAGAAPAGPLAALLASLGLLVRACRRRPPSTRG